MAEPRQDWKFGHIYTPDETWLGAAAEEPVLDPDLPIVDPHHHLWQRGDHRYFLDELLADLNTGHNIVATVFLECRSMYRAANTSGSGLAEYRPVGETEFVAGIAAMSASGNYGPTRVAAGIVGYADLTLGDAVEPVLLAHLRAGCGRFRGVRHSAGWDDSPIIGNSRSDTRPQLYERPDFRAGLKRLSALGLSFDAWLYHPQLADVVDLARAFPATPIVMGHVGGVLGYGPYAGRRDEVFADWKRSMAELARCPNVVVKLGGLAMCLFGNDYHLRPKPPSSEEAAASWRPYIETCIEAFGPDRAMFESNFPPDKGQCSYQVIFNAFKRLSAQYSEAEKTALFSKTATDFYKLDG